jgi:two-component system sensor histidine kinase TctE
MAKSLRAELLAWLLIPLIGVVSFNCWTSYQSARVNANLAIDQMLLGSARVIAEQVKDEDGLVDVSIPPSALEMFASTDRDHVLYRVFAPSGTLIAGSRKNIAVPQTPSDLQPLYFNQQIDDETFRAVVLLQPVISKTNSGNAIIILSTTLGRRDRLVFESWVKSLLEQLLLVGVATIVSVLGLNNGLKPMMRLRSQLLQRSEATLEPVSGEDVQLELRPLIDALNSALERVRNYVTLQRSFVADASHQLRTPLAVLKTQAVFGLRETSQDVKNETLTAINDSLDALTRLVNQLLTLARAEVGADILTKEKINFVDITRSVLERLFTIAIERQIDLSFDCADDELLMFGHSILMQEMIANLVENALRYTPERGEVNVLLDSDENFLRLVVTDTGPGVPASERDKIFERFYRMPCSIAEGTGLGLAIVKEVVAAHRGKVRLSDALPSSTGLRVELFLPLGS